MKLRETLLVIAMSLVLAGSAEASGVFGFRGGATQGTATFSGQSYALTGSSGWIFLGWQLGSAVRFSLFGVGNSLNPAATPTNLSSITSIGYGGSARVKFVDWAFVEGGGGNRSWTFSTLAPDQSYTREASFYFVGMGAEFFLAQDTSIELFLAQSTLSFTDSTITQARTLEGAFGISLYF